MKNYKLKNFDEIQWMPKMDASKNTLYILKIRMPVNMIKYTILDADGNEMGKKGIALSRRFIAEVDDIPSFLIKRIELPTLNWSSDKIAVATIYCYQPVDKSIFSITEYTKKHGTEIFSVDEIPEIHHKGIISKPETRKVRRKEALGNSRAYPLKDCDCLFCVDEVPMHLQFPPEDANLETIGAQMADYIKNNCKSKNREE